MLDVEKKDFNKNSSKNVNETKNSNDKNDSTAGAANEGKNLTNDNQANQANHNQTSSPSLFVRLIDRIKSTFGSPKDAKPTPLKGRIHEEKSKLADRVLDRFLSVAQKIEHKLDSELVNHVQAAMELITRDFRRIQKKAVNFSGEESEKIYNNWMTKAKRWIELDTKLHDRAAIIDTVMKQLFLDLDELIDQDLQVIFDYEAHILADLSVTPQEKNQLEQVILAKLAPHTQALIKLKQHPHNLELYRVAEWKEEVDLRRQKHFEKALHAIDAIIANLSPSAQAVEEEEPDEAMVAITSEMELFHQACAGLLKSVQMLEVNDANGKKNLRPTLLLLQQQAHHLNANLHLTHDLFERLQIIQSDLERIENFIES